MGKTTSSCKSSSNKIVRNVLRRDMDFPLGKEMPTAVNGFKVFLKNQSERARRAWGHSIIIRASDGGSIYLERLKLKGGKRGTRPKGRGPDISFISAFCPKFIPAIPAEALYGEKK